MKRIAIWLIGLIVVTLWPMQLVSANSQPLQITGWIGNPISIQQVSTSDPLLASQWHLDRTRTRSAWDTYKGDVNTVIAVIDTGINARHEDLQSVLWNNTDEIAGNGIDDDQNGYIDDINGYNFLNGNNDLSDGNGHGSGIASIIAAKTNNGLGMAGVNWQARIMVVKALTNLGGGDFSTVAQGIRYAADNGAKLINMSFGSFTSDIALESAVQYAISKQVIIVAAVGNNGGQVLYPAAYPNVIAVGATDRNDQRPPFANYGDNLDVVAPGVDIIMAGMARSDEYVSGSGTSFSAAEVTGILSLVYGKNGGMSVDTANNLITNSTTLINGQTGYNGNYGYGLIDAVKALGSPSSTPVVSPVAPISPVISATPIYQAEWIDQSAYPTMRVGETSLLKVRLRNTGNVGWRSSGSESGQVRLGTDRSKDRASVFYNSEWISKNRIGGMSPTVVQPGEVAEFSFKITAKQAGNFREYFRPVAEYIGWFNDLGIYWDISVVDGSSVASNGYSAELVDNGLTVGFDGKATLWANFKNTGTATWQTQGSSPVRLGTAMPHDHISPLMNGSWISSNRATTVSQTTPPGGVGHFEFSVKTVSNWTASFQMVAEYIKWFGPVVVWRF